MLGLDPVSLVIRVTAIFFSLTVHEFSHAYAAATLGDKTAKWQGRLTLNPMAHIDPVGALALILTGRFGWAKPVPVNPYNFEKRDAGIVMVSIAGPGSNMVLALALAAIYKGFLAAIGYGSAWSRVLLMALNEAVIINLGLAVFNLLPIPPLDGSKILAALLKGSGMRMYYQLEQYSYIILILFISTPIASWILTPILRALYSVIMP